MTFAKAGCKNQVFNVDNAIRELKTRWQCKMAEKKVLPRVWCFGLKHQAKMSLSHGDELRDWDMNRSLARLLISLNIVILTSGTLHGIGPAVTLLWQNKSVN